VKILDRYVLKTFLLTFTSVFVILFFIFILQTVWLYISELAGKDIDLIMVLKFLIYAMPNVVPLVLPLSVLLASIMTFGDLAENYEFAAMKSSGASLPRILRYLIISMILLSIGAFFFANNVIPLSQYKFTNFRRNIAQVKPAMALVEGQFCEVGDYSIKVNKKSGEKGNNLTGITIHKKPVNGIANAIVIKAKTGVLKSSENSNNLQLIMYKGTQYEEVKEENRYGNARRYPFSKTTFSKYTVNMDLSKLNNVDIDANASGTNKMLTVNDLRYTIDSLNGSYKKEKISFAENIHSRSGINNLVNTPTVVKSNDSVKAKPVKKAKKVIYKTPELLPYYLDDEKSRILNLALNNVMSINYSIVSNKEEMLYKEKNINKHWVAFNEKFVLAFSCLLMFFIGAPLGAIIRKGGLGLPIVFAVLIFISFHFINTFGKKVAEENGMSPFLGTWMSTFILMPLAILFTYRATYDSSLINFDFIIIPFENLISKIKNSRKPK
jgi:lipopolysaccharide export system permease protein